MRVYRLVRAAYPRLDGEGARRHGGRWTSPGRLAVYTSEHQSLAVLEVLVNLDLPLEDFPNDYVMLEIEIPDALAAACTTINGPFDENFDFRGVGDGWSESKKSAVLSVPSVVVPAERNFIIAPDHADAGQIKIVDSSAFKIDERLI